MTDDQEAVRRAQEAAARALIEVQRRLNASPSPLRRALYVLTSGRFGERRR